MPRKLSTRLTSFVLLAVLATFLPTPTAGAVADGEDWASLYDGPAGASDGAKAIAIDPTGSRVFVTGISSGDGTGTDYVTIAYDPVNGDELWASRYNGPAGASDEAWDLAVAPDGSRVFVTGYSKGKTPNGYDYATIAYNTATGARVWAARYNNKQNGGDYATSATVSPNGSSVYVTGEDTYGIAHTLAYDSATGARRWVADFAGENGGFDRVLAAPGRVYVVGSHAKVGATQYDGIVISYASKDGSAQWHYRYNGPAKGNDGFESAALGADATRIFATASSEGDGTGDDIVTVALNTSTGSKVWVRRYDGPDTDYSLDYASDIAVSPDGTGVFVSGKIDDANRHESFVTLAYAATNGANIWSPAIYDGPVFSHSGWPKAIAVSPDGSEVYVTGSNTWTNSGGFGVYAYRTIAYDAASGAPPLWSVSHEDATDLQEQATALVVSPDGTRVFVTGQSANDIVTIALSTA